jgi:poly-gamma-glutamate synthesis protein (capsule biosynthesis protein)
MNQCTVNETLLIFVGDTNLQDRKDPAEAFAQVLPTLRGADMLLGHLEGPLYAPSTDPARPDIPHKARWRHSDPAMVEGLRAAGFAGVSLASNVTYGENAIRSTLETLDEAGIAHCGAGRDYAVARQTAIVERGGVRCGLLSYTSVFWPVGHAAGPNTPGVATLRATTAYQPHPRVLEMPGAPAIVVTTPDPQELAAMQDDVRRLREQADIVLVSCHWGVSSSQVIQDYQRVVGRAAIAAGADAVFGHHPHVVQAIEVYQGQPIFYSLGNFAFDWEKMRGRNLDGLLIRCILRDRRLRQVSFVPVRRNAENLVCLLPPSNVGGREIAEQVIALSQEFGTQFIRQKGEVIVGGIADPADEYLCERVNTAP